MPEPVAGTVKLRLVLQVELDIALKLSLRGY